MDCILFFSWFYFFITVAFSDTDVFSCLHLRSLCKQIPDCNRHLRRLESKCGMSLQRCRTTAVSDCIHSLRSIHESLGVYSASCWCYESLGNVRECEYFRSKIWSHPCEKRLNDIGIKDYVSAMEAVYPAPLQNNLLLTEDATNDFDIFNNPEVIVKRTTRSPMATEIKQWKNELNSALPVTATTQPALTCHGALYEICLKHIACRELWKIFRNSCTVDVQNQCRMSNKDDCWQSFEGISWTGLGNCTCHDRNSDCHWIRLQTNYNKCIYELSMAGFSLRDGNRHEFYVQQYQLHHDTTSTPRQIVISKEDFKTTVQPHTMPPVTTPILHHDRNKNTTNDIFTELVRGTKIRHDHHRQMELQRSQQELEWQKRVEQQQILWKQENERYQKQKQERDRIYQEEQKRRKLQEQTYEKSRNNGQQRKNSPSPWRSINVKAGISIQQNKTTSTIPPLQLIQTLSTAQDTSTTTTSTITTPTMNPFSTTTPTTTRMATTTTSTTTTKTTASPTRASRIKIVSSVDAVETDTRQNSASVFAGEYIRSSTSLNFKTPVMEKGSTCGTAHKQCELNETCKWHLSEVQLRCITDDGDCVRTQCAAALRRFSRFVSKQLGEAVAFCQCETADKDCKQLQHLMYPRCMYTYPDRTKLETCTEIANTCKTDSYCNRKLPELNASCSISEGSVCTAKNIDDCRKSLMDIRGTALETPCNCLSSDKTCLAFQSLMIPNHPCVENVIQDYASQHPEYIQPKVLETDPVQENDEEILNNSKYDFAQKNEDTSVLSNVPPPLTNKKTKNTYPKVGSKSASKISAKVPSEKPQIPSLMNSSNEAEYDDPFNSDVSSSTSGITTVEGWRNIKVNPLTIKTHVTSPPPPVDGCVARNIEGNWITHYKNSIVRQYNDWSGQCSEWCQCMENKTLYCQTLPCLSDGNCMTEQTTVAFGERLYIDKRGACICISGEFVCETSANLPDALVPGLYITLGYSKSELKMFKEKVPKPMREASGLVSPLGSVVKDIVSRLQYTMEKHMPKGMLCRIIILKDYADTSTVVLQVQYYGLDIYTNITEPKWQIGKMEKVCSPYVRQLEYLFLLEKAERYQLVLSAVKQIKVIDLLNGLPVLSTAHSMSLTHSVFKLIFTFFVYFVGLSVI